MHQLHLVRAVLVALVLVAASAAPAAAKPGDGTLVAHFSYASVDATAGGLWDCETGDAAGATVSFRYVEGDHLQVPIGSGRPTTWSDVEPYVQVFGCEGSHFAFWAGAYDLSGQFSASQVMLDTYASAILQIDVPLYLDGDLTPVSATFDVTWDAAGAPAVLHEATGLTRQAPATLAGTVTFSGFDELDPTLGAALGNPEWDGTLTFPLDEAAGSLGRRVGTTHP